MKIKPLFTQDEDITIHTLLEKYGIDDVEEYLKPTGKYLESSLLYDNIEDGKDVILSNIDLYIGILMDIDGDGLYSSVLMYKTLKHINPKCKIKVFLHKNRVHGLNDESLMDEILSSGINLLIVPDASSGDFKQHKVLHDNNIDCVCVDHHPHFEYSPYATVVNNQLSDNVINKNGSGALVTFKMCQMLDNKFANTMIDIVWFSLLSDIMDMSSMENRIFSYWGKRKLKNKFLIAMVNKFIGSNPDDLNNESISWKVQPKISAIIRQEDDKIKQKLFLALATEKDEYIDYIIENCEKIHKKQNDDVTKYFNTMLESVNEENRIIFEPIDIYPYYSGLVASKFVDKYNRPTILYRPSKDGYSGSVRSGFPIKQQLIDSGVFTFANGHDSALGVGFKDIDVVSAYVCEALIDDSRLVTLSSDISSISNDLYAINDQYKEIWGHGIEKVSVHIPPFTINSHDIQLLGKDKRTMKFNKDGVDFMLFRISNQTKADFHVNDKKNVKLSVEIIGEPSTNKYMNKTTKQIMINKYEVNVIEDKPIEFDDFW